MESYLIVLKKPVDDNVRDELKKMGVQIVHEPKLNQKFLLIKSELNMEEINKMTFVETVEVDDQMFHLG